MSLPVPWIGPGSCDAADLDKVLEVVEASSGDGRNTQLAETLRRAKSRTDVLPEGLHVRRHVRCAQAMLEMAVEWRMPDVERWAVAWLMAAGGSHLRLRWSSRSRDGRLRQETRTGARIDSLAADHDRVVLGLDDGSVIMWDPSGAQRPVQPAGSHRVWAVAARDQRIVAVGSRNWIATTGWVPGPPALLPPVNGIKAAAIGPGGQIVVGHENGRVQTWAPGDLTWTELCGGARNRCRLAGQPCDAASARCAGTGEQVLAVTFAGVGPEKVRVAWASGEISELTLRSGVRNWRCLHSFAGPVTAAAWTRDGAALAVATGGEVWLVRPGDSDEGADGLSALRAWRQEGVRAVAWSSSGALASASKEQIYSTVIPVPADATGISRRSITSDGEIAAIALPGDGHAVSVYRDQLVQWDLTGAGSDDPTYSVSDPITAVGIGPGAQDRTRVLVGTRLGRLHTYDGTGARVAQDQLATRPKIKELAWSERDGCWLVATLDGLYAYSARDGLAVGAGAGELLDEGFCLHVAASARRYAYVIDGHVVISDAGNLSLDTQVLGLRADPVSGTLAAVDYDGAAVVLRPGQAAPERRDMSAGTRLLAVRDDGSLLVQDPGGGIRWAEPRTDQEYRDLPDGALGAVAYDASQIIVRYPDQGILLTGTGTAPGERSWASARAEVIAAGSRRVVVATQYHLAGYDVLDQGHRGDGLIDLAVRSAGEGFIVTLPGGATVELHDETLGGLDREAPAGVEYVTQSVQELSDAVYRAGQIGDVLWQGGLDLAIDHSRGPEPDRPVQLRWNCPPGDRAADLFPWELLHPSDAPLGWFGESPVTTVRVVAPIAASRQRPGTGNSPTMLVIRGVDPELSAVDNAFDRFRRRTRQTQVDLLRARPAPVATLDELAATLSQPVDILQLWAHSGEPGVRLSPDGEIIPIAAIADCLARPAPRLVVLVGCSSGALGRALVGRGVGAAIAMRVPLYDHTVQPLVEDVTATVLAGNPVDLAFAGALRRYLFTGQPGAAAVPMLYLADGSDGVLFPVKRPEHQQRQLPPRSGNVGPFHLSRVVRLNQDGRRDVPGQPCPDAGRGAGEPAARAHARGQQHLRVRLARCPRAHVGHDLRPGGREVRTEAGHRGAQPSDRG